jgi:hypothetical protein
VFHHELLRLFLCQSAGLLMGQVQVFGKTSGQPLGQSQGDFRLRVGFNVRVQATQLFDDIDEGLGLRLVRLLELAQPAFHLVVDFIVCAGASCPNFGNFQDRFLRIIRRLPPHNPPVPVSHHDLAKAN